MALLKHRPKIRLMAPRELRPGSEVAAELVLETKRELEVEAIEVVVRGEQRVVYGSGQHQHVARAPAMPTVSARLSEKRTLPRGVTRLPFRFELPADAPPSYRGTVAVVEYVLSAHVDIDLWPDARAEFALIVGHVPTEAPKDTPRVYSTAPGGPRGTDAELDVGLATDAVSVGDALVGSIAVAHGGRARVREVKLTLVASDTRLDGGRERGTYAAERHSFRLPMPEEGRATFRLKVPDEAAPTMETSLFRVTWALELEAVVDRGKAPSALLPLTILPRGTTSLGRAGYAPPALGDERVRAMWSTVAAVLGMAHEGDVLRKRVGDVEVVLRRELRGKRGAWIVAELAYPSLHIDVDGGTAGSFRRMIGGGARVGRREWDERHYLTGREVAQVETFVRALPEALFAFELEDIDDTHLVLAMRHAGEHARALEGLARAALEVADSMGAARGAIPPPSAMRESVEAWSKLSRALQGKLEAARMAVHGEQSGMPVHVVTEWTIDAEPRATRVLASPQTPIEEEKRFVWANGAFASGDPSRVPGEARHLLESLAPSLEVRADEDGVATELPAPLHDPTPALDAVRTLTALATLLQAKTGPYR